MAFPAPFPGHPLGLISKSILFHRPVFSALFNQDTRQGVHYAAAESWGRSGCFFIAPHQSLIRSALCNTTG